MHVLTKIFAVLVALLAVLLVPLVVVYAQNEDNYKSKFQAAEARAVSAETSMRTTEAAAAKASEDDRVRLAALEAENGQLAQELAGKDAEIREVQNELVRTSERNAEILAKIAIITETVKASQELNETLVSELRDVRDDALQSSRRVVELDEALRDVTSQLTVAVAARRALEEELQQMRDEQAALLERLNLYIARHGEINDDEVRATSLGGIRPDADLDATIVSVRRLSDGQVLAEIDAGSRDGVKEGWIMTIGRSNFIANLRIISVDINSATGVIELENRSERGAVEVGMPARARRGRS